MSRTSTSQTPSTNTTPACDGTVQSHSLRGLWRLFGLRMPHLQALALKVYSQPISQSTVEQLFSVYEGVMGPKRNKLSFATRIPNATSVPISHFCAGSVFSRIYAYAWWYAYRNRFLCRTAQLSTSHLCMVTSYILLHTYITVSSCHGYCVSGTIQPV